MLLFIERKEEEQEWRTAGWILDDIPWNDDTVTKGSTLNNLQYWICATIHWGRTCKETASSRDHSYSDSYTHR